MAPPRNGRFAPTPKGPPARLAELPRGESYPATQLRYTYRMHFIDECTMTVKAGDGGNGISSFRREKHVEFGGPSGGDGGRGGNVTFVADPGLGTLQDVAHLRHIRAERGGHGQTKDRYGRSGADSVLRMPLGTIVFDAETGEKLVELTRIGQEEVIARGGDGGLGNKHFTTPTDRAPKKFTLGRPGEQFELRLELKVMADIGLLGYPNVGKSTFIRSVSRARPRVADYPFTTLEPHLGVVTLGDERSGLASSFVVADIPGLIAGASKGAGLGARFLRHVERTRGLLHLITLTDDPERDPVADYEQLRFELAEFKDDLTRRPELVALSQADRPEVVEAYPGLKQRFAELGVELRLVSAVSRAGLPALVADLAALVGDRGAPESEPESEPKSEPMASTRPPDSD